MEVGCGGGLLVRIKNFFLDPTSCEDSTADIVFVLDASSSEGSANFKKQLDFVTNLTES